LNAVEKCNWNKTRQKGKLSFILRETLFLGLVCTFVYILLDYFGEFFLYDTPNYLHKSENFVFKILLCLAVFSLAGLLTGYYSWRYNEEKYLQNSEEK
jgi:hypothetical protein